MCLCNTSAKPVQGCLSLWWNPANVWQRVAGCLPGAWAALVGLSAAHTTENTIPAYWNTTTNQSGTSQLCCHNSKIVTAILQYTHISDLDTTPEIFRRSHLSDILSAPRWFSMSVSLIVAVSSDQSTWSVPLSASSWLSSGVSFCPISSPAPQRQFDRQIPP